MRISYQKPELMIMAEESDAHVMPGKEAAVELSSKGYPSSPFSSSKNVGGGSRPALKQKKPVIAVANVTKVYKSILGVNDVTLNIYPGITGLLGPNGAGKSTLLKMMAGLVKPSKGVVMIEGRSITKDPYLFEKIGYVSEYDSFYPEMTGFEYVVFFLKMHGIEEGEAHRRATLILEKLEMKEQMNRLISGYSKGMKQKIKIARALAFDPDIILLDEPLQGTDPETRNLIIQNIKHWGSMGKMVLVSSHILHEIERLTSDIVLINKGRVYAVGDIARLRAMMDEHPHKIEVELFCREDVRPLAGALLSCHSVDSSTVMEGKNKIFITTSQPGVFFREFPDVATRLKVKVRSMYSIDDNLQSLYYYLMEKRGW